MELPASNAPLSPSSSPSRRSSPTRRSGPVHSTILLFCCLLGLFTLVVRRLVVFGDPTLIVEKVSTRELWVPWSSLFLPHRKRETLGGAEEWEEKEEDYSDLSSNTHARLALGVITGSNELPRVRAAQRTWVKSLDPEKEALVFFSDKTDPWIPTLGIAGTGKQSSSGEEDADHAGSERGSVLLPVDAGASWVGAQSRWLPALSHLYNTYQEAEWYMILDDDTFLVPQGLRRMLGKHDSSKPLYVGRVMFAAAKQQDEEHRQHRLQQQHGKPKQADAMVPFAHGGSGVVLSRPLLKALVPFLGVSGACEYSGYGDGDLGYCIAKHTGANVTHEACLHSDTPEAFERRMDLFLPLSDLDHPCTFHYAFRAQPGAATQPARAEEAGGGEGALAVNRMDEWHERYNSDHSIMS